MVMAVVWKNSFSLKEWVVVVGRMGGGGEAGKISVLRVIEGCLH